jgi:hypothetical protein
MSLQNGLKRLLPLLSLGLGLSLVAAPATFAGTSSSAGDEPDHTISIAFGTYYGECLGYCVDIYELAPSPVMEDHFVTHIQHGWDRTDPSYPVRSETRSISKEDFHRLAALADVSNFAHLADVYGCPDCADGGAHWIRITSAFGARGKVDYDRLEDVEAALDPELFRRFFKPLHTALFDGIAKDFRETGVKLYPPETPLPSPLCDLHTKLVLKPVGLLGQVAILKADMTEPAGCDASPNPLARAYRIRAATTDECRSVYYDGVFSVNGKTFTIKIADHRQRTCDDRVPNVEVTETDDGGVVTSLVGTETDTIYYP